MASRIMMVASDSPSPTPTSLPNASPQPISQNQNQNQIPTVDKLISTFKDCGVFDALRMQVLSDIKESDVGKHTKDCVQVLSEKYVEQMPPLPRALVERKKTLMSSLKKEVYRDEHGLSRDLETKIKEILSSQTIVNKMQEELRLCVSKAQKCETSKPQKVSVSVPRKAFTVRKIAIRASGLKSVTSSPTIPTAHTDPASTNMPQLVENVTQVNPTKKSIVPATSDTPTTTTNIVPEPNKAEQSQVTDKIEPDVKITPSEPSTQENKQVKPENPIKEKAPKGTTEMKDTDGMKQQTQETQGEKIAKEHKKKSPAQNKRREHKSLPKKHKKRIVSSSSSSSSSSSDKESSSSSTEKKRKGHHHKPKRSKKEEKTNSESSSSSKLKRKKHKLTSSTKELPTQTDTDADRKESKSKKSRKNKEAKPKPVKSSLQASNLDAQEEKIPAVQEDKPEQSIETINQLPTQPEQPQDAKTPLFPSDQPVRRKCGRPKKTLAVDTTEQSSSLLKDEGSQENNTQEVTVPARKRRKIMASNATPVAELTEQTTNLPIATSTESTKEPILTEERPSKLELQAIPDETKDDSLQPESQLKSKKRKRLSEAERLKKSLADDVPPYAPKPLVEISSLLGPSLATRARHKIVDSDTIKGEVATTKPKSPEEQVVIRQARIPWTKRRKIPYV